jgi:hypothetical protein
VTEAPFTSLQKLGCALTVMCIVVPIGWFLFTISVVGHDKSVNSRLQRLWSDAGGVPLGTVVPANNRWMENAFVADQSGETGKQVVVLILDDHYRSGDESLRSESGVIGDSISPQILCSIPMQARTRQVVLDPAVRKLIADECQDFE